MMRSVKLMVISTLPTHPQDEGANRRVFAMMELLREQGIDLHFCFIPRNAADISAMRAYWDDRFHLLEYRDPVSPVKRTLLRVKSKLRIAHNFGIDDWFDTGLLESLSLLRDTIRPDAVLVEYVYLSKALDLFSHQCLKIIDTHDVMTERQARSIAQGQPPRWFSTTATEEGRGLSRANLVLAIQNKERDFLQTLSSARVVTVGHITPVQASWSFVEGSADILYVGTNNPSNVQAIQAFVQKVMPELRARRPASTLHVVGKVCSALNPSAGVVLHGVVPDVADFYSKVKLAINPVLFGTGLKIKNVEAMSFGCPLLTTPVGAEGLEAGGGSAFYLHDGLAGMAEAIDRLIDDAARLRTFSVQGARLVQQLNAESTAALLDVLIPGALAPDSDGRAGRAAVAG